MKLVIIESPLRADTPEGYERNRQYARACMRDSLERGEAPYASHLLYDQPGILDDTVPAEREQGIRAGFAWGERADITAVYVDLGESGGMKRGIEQAFKAGRPVEMRSIEGWEAVPDGPEEDGEVYPTADWEQIGDRWVRRDDRALYVWREATLQIKASPLSGEYPSAVAAMKAIDKAHPTPQEIT